MKKALVLMMFVVQVGAAELPQRTHPGQSQTRTNLQAEFLRLTAKLDPESKDTPKEKQAILVRLLKEGGETVRQREFSRLLSPPGTNSFNKFDRLLLDEFASNLIWSGDTGSLQKLLVARCPDYVRGMPLEYALACKEPRAVSVLFAAYSASGTNASSKVILRCLARAFPNFREEIPSDHDFVETCRGWLETNSATCRLTVDYPYLTNSSLMDLMRAEEGEVGLFFDNRPQKRH